MKLLLDAPRVWSGQTTDQTRVLAQNVHNYWSDRLIMLKFLQEFPEAVFLGIATRCWKCLVELNNQPTKVRAEEVYNSWSDCWVELNILQEFPKATFLGVAMKSLLDADGILSGQTTNLTRVLA